MSTVSSTRSDDESFELSPVAHGPAARLGAERGQRARGQRHQIRTAAEGERQVERVRVVDRVERAQRQERQVQAVGGEDRVAVVEPAVGHVHREPVRDPRHPDPAQRPRPRLGPGQPRRIRRPGEVLDVAVVAGGQLGDLPGRQVDEQEPPVVRGGGHRGAVRGRGQAGHVAELTVSQPHGGGRRTVDDRDLEGVHAAGVSHPHDLAGRAEHAGLPGAGVRGHGQGPGGAVGVGQPVHRAAHFDHAGLAGLVAVQVAEVVRRGDQLGGAGTGRRAELDVELARLCQRPGRPGSRCRPRRGRRSASRPSRGCGRRSRRGRCAGAGRCRRARTSRCCRCPRGRRRRPAVRRRAWGRRTGR